VQRGKRECYLDGSEMQYKAYQRVLKRWGLRLEPMILSICFWEKKSGRGACRYKTNLAECREWKGVTEKKTKSRLVSLSMPKINLQELIFFVQKQKQW